MKPIVWNAILAGAIAILPGTVFAQAVRGTHPSGENSSHGGAARGGQMGGHRGGAPSGKASAAPHSSAGFGSRLGRSVTDPSFGGRLGRTVGGYPAQTGPAYGNINHPAGQTGIQPSPASTGLPIPNINYPGGSPGLYGGLPGEQGGRRHHRGHSGYGGVYGGPIYYGVPYYVPVPVYTEVVPEAPPDPEPPRAFDIREYMGAAPVPAQPQQVAPARPVRPVTLLAFKDDMVIAVTDYWLDGYSLVYETSLGVRTHVPIDRLDFYLTQQLNLERNVPFVLEARP